MTGAGSTGVRQLVGRLACGVAVVGLIGLMLVSGCDDSVTGAAEVTTAEDECLFAGEAVPEKGGAEAVMSEDDAEKANLDLRGQWRHDTVAVGTWERHRILTHKDYMYIVELCTQTAGSLDDPDLYLSRDEDPKANAWKTSVNFDPWPDTIVFRSKKDGIMYVGVHGWNTSDDGNVDYSLRVRRRLNPTRG